MLLAPIQLSIVAVALWSCATGGNSSIPALNQANTVSPGWDEDS